ncbi:MAG: hypothetical protein ACTSXZ_11675 [Alphaproteobacteria bacterium]
MSDKAQPKQGVIEGASRVLRELLRTPRFKQSVRILLRDLDAENTPLLLRAIQEEDPELFLSLLTSAPQFANTTIAGAHELWRQLLTFPPELLASFLADALGDLQTERLGEAGGLFLALLLKASDQQSEKLQQATTDLRQGVARGFATALSDEGIEGDRLLDLLLQGANSLAVRWGAEAAQPDSVAARRVGKTADAIREIAAQNPDFINHVVRPLVAAIQAAENDDE